MNLRNHLDQIFNLKRGPEAQEVSPQISEQQTVEVQLKSESGLDFLSRHLRSSARMQTWITVVEATVHSGSSVASYSPVVLYLQSRLFT